MRYLSAWLPVLVLEMGIIFLSSRPQPPVPSSIPHLDKVLHFMEYAALGALLFRAFHLSGARTREAVASVLALAALLGLGDEKLQSHVPGRDSSITDWFADVAGATAGVWFGIIAVRRGFAAWTAGAARRKNEEHLEARTPR